MTKYDYYISLAFSKDYLDLREDTKLELFNEFLTKLRCMLPHMRYIAIPCLTPKGHLHFYLFTSGITPQDIKSVSSKDIGDKTYYYVDEWTYGYGTMSKLYKAVIA